MSDLEKEECPICKKQHMVRKKRLLIDEAWTLTPGKDPRLKYFADLRVDDLKHTSPSPLEQFIELDVQVFVNSTDFCVGKKY